MLEILLYVLLALIGGALILIALIGVLLFVTVWVVAAAEAFAYRMFSSRE